MMVMDDTYKQLRGQIYLIACFQMADEELSCLFQL